MINMKKATVPLFCLGLYLVLLSTLESWWDETTGQAEIDRQIKLDIESCWPLKPHRMSDINVLMCEKVTLVKPDK